MLQAELSHHRHAAALSSEQISMHSVFPARGTIFFFVNRKKADCQNAQSSTKSCWEEGVLGLPSCAPRSGDGAGRTGLPRAGAQPGVTGCKLGARSGDKGSLRVTSWHTGTQR